jgi:hypothetical protein
MRGARWLYVVLGVAVLVGLFFLLRPGEEEPTAGTSPSPRATPTQSATGTWVSPWPTAAGSDALEVEIEVEEGRIQIEVEGHRQRVPARIRISRGDRVSIKTESDTPQEVHVHGYDLIVNVPAGAERTRVLRADVPGVFEVELEGSHRLIFELEVLP